MGDQPDDELIRELYAAFGLAYFRSECLHRGLCISLVYLKLPKAEFITRPRVEELLARSYSLTLGEVAEKLERILPDKWNIELKKAVEVRNFIAHHFWFDRVHLMFSIGGTRSLIVELHSWANMFDKLDVQISEWSEVKEKQKELGISDKELKDSLRDILAGGSEEPLADKKTVRELEKKLRKKQLLIRVWENALEGEGSRLIFELADGTLLQLSDVGLGPTRIQALDQDWKEHETIKLHLPAEIDPRPKSSGPLDYEFTLGNEVTLWVKPGSRKQTFRWGLKNPS